VMLPKLAVPKVAPGIPKRGVFVKWNDSNRNCTLIRSRIANSLLAEKSQLKNPRCRIMLRPAFPTVYGALLTNAAVLKSCCTVRVVEYGSPTKFGRFTVENVPVLAGLPEEITLNGTPLATVMILPTAHPPAIASNTLGIPEPKRLPFPNGSS